MQNHQQNSFLQENMVGIVLAIFAALLGFVLFPSFQGYAGSLYLAVVGVIFAIYVLDRRARRRESQLAEQQEKRLRQFRILESSENMGDLTRGLAGALTASGFDPGSVGDRVVDQLLDRNLVVKVSGRAEEGQRVEASQLANRLIEELTARGWSASAGSDSGMAEPDAEVIAGRVIEALQSQEIITPFDPLELAHHIAEAFATRDWVVVAESAQSSRGDRPAQESPAVGAETIASQVVAALQAGGFVSEAEVQQVVNVADSDLDDIANRVIETLTTQGYVSREAASGVVSLTDDDIGEIAGRVIDAIASRGWLISDSAPQTPRSSGADADSIANRVVAQLAARGFVGNQAAPGAAKLPGTRLSFFREAGIKTDLRGVDLSNANLEEAALYHVDLQQADLRGANLRSANLFEANLDSADLSGADLSNADLREAHLHATDLRGANLEGVNLGDEYGQAHFDISTILPDGSNWSPEVDLGRYTDPAHPYFQRG